MTIGNLEWWILIFPAKRVELMSAHIWVVKFTVVLVTLSISNLNAWLLHHKIGGSLPFYLATLYK